MHGSRWNASSSEEKVKWDQAIRMAKVAYRINPRLNRLRIRHESWDTRTCVVVFNDRDLIFNSCWPAGDDPIWTPVKMTRDSSGWTFEIDWVPSPADALFDWDVATT